MNRKKLPNSRSRGSFIRTCALLLLISISLSWFYLSNRPPVVLNPNYGLLHTTSASSRVAIATFLSGDSSNTENDNDDPYFLAARILTYQLLHDPQTQNNNNTQIPFLILATTSVSERKRTRLTLDGATVIPVEDLPLPSWISTGVTRWKDQFTKLRIFEMVEYERILFIDADTLLTHPIDGIFNEDIITTPSTTLPSRQNQLRRDEAPLPANYLFAARSDNAFKVRSAYDGAEFVELLL
ncbi:hypothetical protein G7Y89_g15556 [Cudoniella acicularis]|uniref:Nucleotide-diphospho-sugar transferase n=1 Tax=Cudoniella acicularis TaxID=354080 RepID=A0A8H4QM46_9HELO|nr:hypothetical protein G7Y89_g15556 [Cudoniella acicularis]